MYNVLIVDDDKEIVNAIAIYLKNEGYKIYKAYDGNQAVEKIERTRNTLNNTRYNDARKRWNRNTRRNKKKKKLYQ